MEIENENENEEMIQDHIKFKKEPQLNINLKNEENEPQLEPNQIMILISRLRQERDELRCAVRFLNIEQSSLIKTYQTHLLEIKDEFKEKERLNELQRDQLGLSLVEKNRSNGLKSEDGSEERKENGLKSEDGSEQEKGNGLKSVEDPQQDHHLMQIEPFESHESVHHSEHQNLIQEKSRSEDLLPSRDLINQLNTQILNLNSKAKTNENLLEIKENELQSIKEGLSISKSNVNSYELQLHQLKEEVHQLKTQVLEPQPLKLEPEKNESNQSDHLAQDDLLKELNQTQISLNETISQVSDLKEVRLKNEKTIEEIEEHCVKLCIELQEKSDELIQVEGRLKRMESEIEENQTKEGSDGDELSLKFMNSNESERKTKIDGERVEDEILEFKRRTKDLKTEEKDLMNELDLISNEETKLKLKERIEKLFKAFTLTYHELEKSQSEKEKSQASFESQLDESNQRIQETDQVNQQLLQQINSYEEHNQQLEMIRNELSNQLALSTSKLKEYENETEEDSMKMKGRIRELSVMVDELRNEKEKLIHLPDLIDQINLQHERIRDELTDRLGGLSNELIEVRNEKEENLKKFEVEIEVQKKRVEELEDELGVSQESSNLNQINLKDLNEARNELEGLKELMMKFEE
ncbi:hypothetical protein DFH28DRAFT_405156 [Melampsora americana]|nr:hypothetical protein DFH28DRAFT_405156 [Melampsora americana]